MINVVDRITGDGTFRALLARIREIEAPSGEVTAQNPSGGKGDEGVVSADGLWGSFAPILAATVISLICLLNVRPRWASIRPFLCLIVLHLECPDIFSIPRKSGL